jgi:nitrile hydratase
MTDGIHDMGGMDGFGAVVEPGSDAVFHAAWEERAFALNLITGSERLRHNNGRATREEMDPLHYLAASYYERWLSSTERGLVEAGTISSAEIDAWVERLRAGEAAPTLADGAMADRAVAVLVATAVLPVPEAPAHAVGDRVRVRRTRPRGHTRSPRYLRGVGGVVERVQCVDRLPDPGPRRDEPVYAVRFRSEDVFGEGDEPGFTILADMWESYLEADA